MGRGVSQNRRWIYECNSEDDHSWGLVSCFCNISVVANRRKHTDSKVPPIMSLHVQTPSSRRPNAAFCQCPCQKSAFELLDLLFLQKHGRSSGMMVRSMRTTCPGPCSVAVLRTLDEPFPPFFASSNSGFGNLGRVQLGPHRGPMYRGCVCTCFCRSSCVC